MFQLDERVIGVEQLDIGDMDLDVVCNRVSDDNRVGKRSTCEVGNGWRERRRRRRWRVFVVLRRAEGKLGPLVVRELINGNPAPLYGIPRVAALDGEAACEQVFD